MNAGGVADPKKYIFHQSLVESIKPCPPVGRTSRSHYKGYRYQLGIKVSVFCAKMTFIAYFKNTPTALVNRLFAIVYQTYQDIYFLFPRKYVHL